MVRAMFELSNLVDQETRTWNYGCLRLFNHFPSTGAFVFRAPALRRSSEGQATDVNDQPNASGA